MALSVGSTKKENGATDIKNSGDFINRVSCLLRPLERKITNIMVPENPVKARTTPLAPVEIKNKFASVASIILNPPFIKIVPRAPGEVVPKRKYESSEESETSSDDDPAGPVDTKSMDLENPDFEGKSGIQLRRKRKQTPYYQAQDEDDKDDKPKRHRERKSRKGKVSGPKSKTWISRASMRLLEKLRQDAIQSRNGPAKPRAARVSRTVELVNQSGEGWREENAKLLYVLSLGLSPKPEAPVIGPIIRVTQADPVLVASIEKRYEAERIIRLERERIENEKLDRLRQQLNRSALELMKRQLPVEVIDLASDDEVEDENFHDVGYILPDFYPDVRIDPIDPVIPRIEIKKQTNQTSKQPLSISANPPYRLPSLKEFVSTILDEPLLKENQAKTLNTVKMNGVNRVKRTGRAQKGPNKNQNSQIYIRPTVSLEKIVPERRTSCIYVTPSPPMRLDMAPVSAMIEELKSQSTDFQRSSANIFGYAGYEHEEEDVIQID